MENLETRRDFKKLYEIQDKILKLTRNKNIDFYLTGGTALHRFHYQDVTLKI